MKAVVINHYGDREVLEEQEVPYPTASDDQVIIEVHAAAINPIDWNIRNGVFKEMLPFSFPVILGWDVAGTVVEIGATVSGIEIGDAVFAKPALSSNGSYASFTAVDAKYVAKIPTNLSFVEAATIPLAGLTAWESLVKEASLQPGEKVLIHAGAGGVGSLAIQIAKHIGAYVITTASSKNQAYLKELGADQVINYQTEDFEQVVTDVDVVLDTIAGETLEKSCRVMKPGGRIVSILGSPDQALATRYNINVSGYWVFSGGFGTELTELAKLLESGAVEPQLGKVFDFSKQGVQAAHKESESHHTRGKLVLKMK